MSEVLRMEGVRHAWSAGGPALCVPQWRLPAGQSIWLSGASGTGKSTLLQLVAGVLAPQQGQVWVAGAALHGSTARQRDALRKRHVGWVAQQFNLLPYLSAQDNAWLPARLGAGRSLDPDQLQQRWAQLTQAFGLDAATLARPARTLSVGQQQRVAAMRALLTQPELILADEPTSALDGANAHALMRTLSEQAQALGSTVIVASHEAWVGDYLAQRAVIQRDAQANSVLEVRP
jgi:putative ABC transport system ATP-binding protein